MGRSWEKGRIARVSKPTTPNDPCSNAIGWLLIASVRRNHLAGGYAGRCGVMPERNVDLQDVPAPSNAAIVSFLHLRRAGNQGASKRLSEMVARNNRFGAALAPDCACRNSAADQRLAMRFDAVLTGLRATAFHNCSNSPLPGTGRVRVSTIQFRRRGMRILADVKPIENRRGVE